MSSIPSTEHNVIFALEVKENEGKLGFEPTAMLQRNESHRSSAQRSMYSSVKLLDIKTKL